MLAPEIPPTVIVRREEVVAAALAEALLEEKVLKESDWDGRSIASSIGAGLTRWAAMQLGGKDLQRIDLGLFWTDNIQAASGGMNPQMWREMHGKPAQMPPTGWPGYTGDAMQPRDEPVGVLAIQSCHDGHPHPWPHHRDCVVGPTVLELEAARPGLGFQVLNLLADVLPPLVGTAFPHYAHGEARKYRDLAAWMEYIPDLADTLEKMRCTVAPEQVAAVVPDEALHGKLKPEALRSAQKARLEPRHREIVEAAVEVLNRFEALRSDMRVCHAATLCAANQTIGFASREAVGMAAKLPTFAVRWSRMDGIPEVLSSYLRQLAGRGTNLAWCQAWVASDPESIRRAVRNWRAVTALVLRACRLAEMLHKETP